MDIEVREAIFARNADQDPTHVGHNINVTSMLGCMRSTYLERTIDYAASPLGMWWTLRGELIHRLVERPDHDNPELRRSELQLSAELDGIPITGRVDSYKLRFLDYGVLKDWKSIGDNGLQYIIYDGAKEDHVWQTNIYAWLLRKWIPGGHHRDRLSLAHAGCKDRNSSRLSRISGISTREDRASQKHDRQAGTHQRIRFRKAQMAL
jgi:hypothetical protein